MLLSTSLLLALPLAAVNAKPLYPSKVIRQETPEPSEFPLDGGPCGNEWQYLNFNTENAVDRERLQKLHDVICIGELRALSARGAYAAELSNNVYALFFDTEDGLPAEVEDVLMMIAGDDTAGTMVGDVVADMVIDNNDFGEGDNTCAGGTTFAYTVEDENDGYEKIHFCDIAFDLPTAAPDIDCGSLDPYPSYAMDTFSRVALHETLHYSTVGPASELGNMIVDQFNLDGFKAYGPERAHGLNDPNQDDDPGRADSNADNYAFMALDGWISYNCQPDENWASFFPDAPPNYR